LVANFPWYVICIAMMPINMRRLPRNTGRGALARKVIHICTQQTFAVHRSRKRNQSDRAEFPVRQAAWRFASVYFNMSQGDADMRVGGIKVVNGNLSPIRGGQSAVDGGARDGSVQLKPEELSAVEQNAERTASEDLDADPATGAELGSADGAGTGAKRKSARSKAP
jgi:hypothetical protein